jgi:outer membrane immunogenic protein
MMKTISLATAVLVSSAMLSGAMAADMAPHAYTKAPAMVSPATNWSGFYAGVNGGYASGNSNLTPITNEGALVFGGSPDVDTFASPQPRGFVGGGQLGYNWQTGMWLIGGEVDFDWLNAKANETVGRFASGTPGPATFSNQFDWLLTARLRAGVTVTPNWLVYATGGFAATRAKNTINHNDIGDGEILNWSESKVLPGWTVGAGTEYALASNWSLKAEYLYAKFGDTSPSGIVTDLPTGPSVSVGSIAKFDHSLNIVRAGVNYHFN